MTVDMQEDGTILKLSRDKRRRGRDSAIKNNNRRSPDVTEKATLP